MNIAFVNSTRKWGGVKTWCINTASELAKLGVEFVHTKGVGCKIRVAGR